MAFIIFQRDIIRESFLTVLKVEVLWFVLLLLCYWIILPLTALSYKFISPKPKKVDMTTTVLAHLAGAGPGRIIPGGIGNISITAIHLKKTGLSIEQALGVVITNNVVGLISNGILLTGVLFMRPESTKLITENISSLQLFVVAIIIVAFLVLLQWLLHARGTRKEINKTAKQWRKILLKFMTHPGRVGAVIIIALLISLIHTFMLDLSAYALGIHLSIADALIAVSFGVVIGGVFPTPGGIGGVEAGITAALIVLGLGPAEAASVAVLFRVATYWQPLLPGTLAYLYLREKELL